MTKLYMWIALIVISSAGCTSEHSDAQFKDNSGTGSEAPPPRDLDPIKLPVGTRIILKKPNETVIPGAHVYNEIGTVNYRSGDRPPAGSVCQFFYSEALFQRAIPGKAEFIVEGASFAKVERNVGVTTFQVSSKDVPFIEKIVCFNHNWEGKNHPIALPQLACIFDIKITVPVGASNPPLACDDLPVQN